MAALIRKELGLETAVVPGRTGEFSVWAGNERVLDKDELGGFPRDEDVVDALRGKAQSNV